MGLMSTLLRWRTHRVLGPFATAVLRVYGVDVPKQVTLGADVVLWHRGQGVVMSPYTVIGQRVHVFHQVTIGGADPVLRHDGGVWPGVRIEDDVILCVGAKVLGGSELLTVGRGTIVAANAVLLTSTGEYEIWGGIPAKLIGRRTPGQRNLIGPQPDQHLRAR